MWQHTQKMTWNDSSGCNWQLDGDEQLVVSLVVWMLILLKEAKASWDKSLFMESKTTFRGLPCPTLVVLAAGLWYVMCTWWHIYQFPLALWSVLGQSSVFQVLYEWIIMRQFSVASRLIVPLKWWMLSWRPLSSMSLNIDRMQFSNSGEGARCHFSSWRLAHSRLLIWDISGMKFKHLGRVCFQSRNWVQNMGVKACVVSLNKMSL